LKSNYIFKLDQYPEAKEVTVAGSFNGWNADNFFMVKKRQQVDLSHLS